MIKLYRKIVFYFNWSETIRRCKKAEMGYPLLVMLEFNKALIRHTYLTSGDYSQVLMQFFEKQDKLRSRMHYKNKKRREMQDQPDFDYQAWEARVRSWRHHLQISEAIRKADELDGLTGYKKAQSS